MDSAPSLHESGHGKQQIAGSHVMEAPGHSTMRHVRRRDRLRANPSEHPLMLAEPTLNTRELREKTVELAFEKLSPPALFLARNAVLTSFAMGRQSSLVVDAAHEGTTGVMANLS